MLFVEDDVGKRYVISRQLRAAGFEVEEAETGEQGLAMLSPEHDVAILDIKLPDMYGWDVCKRIKANPDTASVKVLELSATLASAEDRARGLELGADCYLVHPVELVELVAALRALIRLRYAERDKLRAQQLFLATLGHDLRNPLGTIATGLSVLYESQNLDENDRGTIRRIDRTLERMRRMIDQLLLVTRNMNDVVPVSPQRIDLCELCRQVTRDVAPNPARPLDVVCEGTVTVAGDHDKLVQLVDNLVTNAIRHGDGPVTIAIRRTEREGILSVHNGGPPIPVTALGTLFDPFVRAGGREGGVGLGLYIVDQIARAHGGTVEVTSSADAGTTFSVKFPL
ncbi:MAG TPA: ATP-binding protein [Kofleriaceae bacterium]|nr:ATP-binding protein [Kofleriaceae bacterium]